MYLVEEPFHDLNVVFTRIWIWHPNNRYCCRTGIFELRKLTFAQDYARRHLDVGVAYMV